MKNLFRSGFLSLLLIALPALGQNVIKVNASGAIHLARSINWAQASSTGPGVAFVWAPLPGTNYACFTVSNLFTVSPRSNISVSVWVSTDPANTIFNSQLGTQLGLQGSPYVTQVYSSPAVNFGQFIAGAPSAKSGYANVGGAAQVVVWISNATSSGLLGDVFDFVEADSPTPCASGGNIGSFMSGGERVCTQFGVFTAATGTGTAIQQGGSNIYNVNQQQSIYPKYHICAFSISGPTAPTSAIVGLTRGTTATACPTSIPANTVGYAFTVPVGIPTGTVSGPGPQGEWLEIDATNALCLVNSGTGSTITGSISYGIW